MEATRPSLSVLAFLGPAIAWAIHLMIVYPLVPLVCSTGHRWLFWLAHVTTIAAAIGCTLLAIRIRQKTGADGNEQVGRARFLGLLGIWAGVFFVFAIAFESLPTILLDPCR